jgi:hypothetical protein
VRVTAEGGQTRELWHATPNGTWNDQALDLNSLAGQVVRLDLEVSGTAAGRVAWSAPAIMVAPPRVAERPGQVKNVVVLLIDTLRASSCARTTRSRRAHAGDRSRRRARRHLRSERRRRELDQAELRVGAHGPHADVARRRRRAERACRTTRSS